MAATDASMAPVVQEDGKAADTKVTEGEQPAKTASEEAVPTQSSENASSAESKTSFLDSFLNKSGLGKVMGGRKKKEQSTAGGDENATEGGEKEAEKGGEEAEGGEEGDAGEGEAAIEKTPENGEKEEDKKVEKGKQVEAKSTVRDLIRKPVARIFSHRSTDKKDGTGTAEPQKPVKVRSKSLDRLEDPEALNAADSTIEEGGEEGGGMEEEEHKASSTSATTKHMKRWHSFKKLMAQKTHRKSCSGGEEGKEEGAEGVEGGGGDSSTLDSKESGQKRWKLKRSWTFQGLKRDPSMVGFSSKVKSSDKAEKTEQGSEEEKGAVGGGTVTQHANEIWTSFKKRVIPKSKRSNTECPATGEEDTTTTEGKDAKDGKSAKAKRSHFGRAVSLKNFILRKGKSTSVDLGEGTKEAEEEEEEDGGVAAEGGGVDGEVAAMSEEANDKMAAGGETPAVAKESGGEAAKEAEKTQAEVPVTNGENSCSNGTAEETTTHNHQEEQEEKMREENRTKSRASGGDCRFPGQLK
uniref:Si:ch211-137a8.4 n=1 Tax=Myripristis murdjan TaxID=586833 RepID=A0A667WUW1_9TELE